MGKTTFYAKGKRLEKLGRNEQLELVFDLINAFRIVRTPTETAFLLRDLLTANEIKNLAKRLRIAKLVIKGETDRDIADNLHCSFGTITKVKTWLNSGGEGLYNVISKLPIKYNLPKNLPSIPIEFQMPRVLLALAQYKIATDQNKLVQGFDESLRLKKIMDRELGESLKGYYSRRKRKIS